MRDAAKRLRDENIRIKTQLADETYLPARADLINTFTADPEVSRGTRQSRMVAARFLAQLQTDSGIRLSEAKRSHLQKLRAAVIDTDLRTSTKNLRLSQLRAFFNLYAETFPFLNRDVVRKELRNLKDRSPVRHGNHLTPPQLQALLAKALEIDAEHAAFFALCFLCGCRPSEIIALNKRADGPYSFFVDEAGRPPQLEVRARKTSKLRRVGFAIAPITIDLLRTLASRKGEAFWFARTQQRSRIGLQDYTPQKVCAEKLRGQLGWHFKLTDLRASSAAYLSHLQVNPSLVVDRMGHSQSVSQDSYLEGVNTLDVPNGARRLEDAAQIVQVTRSIIDSLAQ